MKLPGWLAAILMLGAVACDDAVRPGGAKRELAIQPDLIPTLFVGSSFQLQAMVDGQASSEVDWESSDESVATIDQAGLLTARESGIVQIRAVFRGDRAARDSVLVTVEPFNAEIPGPTLTIEKVLDHASQVEITNRVLKDSIDVQVFWDAPPIMSTGQIFVQLRSQFLCSHKFRDAPRGTHTCTIDTRPFPNDTARLTALLADTAGRYIATSTSRLFTISN